MNEEEVKKTKSNTKKKTTSSKKTSTNKKATPNKKDVKVKEVIKENNNNGMTSEMMNLIIIGAIFLALLGLITIPTLFSSNNTNTINKGTIIDATTAYDYNTLLNSDSEKIIYLGSSGCKYCIKFTPILNELVKEKNIDIYYFDLATTTEEVNVKIFESFNDTLKNGFGTPTLLIVKDGKIVTQSVGYKEKDGVLSFLESNNINISTGPNTTNNNDDQTTPETSYDTSSYTLINTNQYIELHGRNEYSVIYMGRSSCSACVSFNPTMKKIADDYNITVYYYDTDKESDNIYDMAQYNSVILENNRISTPSIFILKDNAVVDHLIGGQSAETIVSLLSKYEIIK